MYPHKQLLLMKPVRTKLKIPRHTYSDTDWSRAWGLRCWAVTVVINRQFIDKWGMIVLAFFQCYVWGLTKREIGQSLYPAHSQLAGLLFCSLLWSLPGIHWNSPLLRELKELLFFGRTHAHTHARMHKGWSSASISWDNLPSWRFAKAPFPPSLPSLSPHPHFFQRSHPPPPLASSLSAPV